MTSPHPFMVILTVIKRRISATLSMLFSVLGISSWGKSYHNQSHFGQETLFFLQRKSLINTRANGGKERWALQLSRSAGLAPRLLGRLFFFSHLRGIQCSIFAQQKKMQHMKVGYKPAAGYRAIITAAKTSARIVKNLLIYISTLSQCRHFICRLKCVEDSSLCQTVRISACQ